MTNPDGSAGTLGIPLNRLLREEIDLSGQLLELISDEKALMAQPLPSQESGGVNSTLEQKTTLLRQLQEVSGKRQDLMLLHGFDCTPQGVEFCSLACADDPGVRESFRRLGELARECHAANQMLGQLLNRKAGFFSRLLNNLSENAQEPLYQANGQREEVSSLNLRGRLSV